MMMLTSDHANNADNNKRNNRECKIIRDWHLLFLKTLIFKSISGRYEKVFFLALKTKIYKELKTQ